MNVKTVPALSEIATKLNAPIKTARLTLETMVPSHASEFFALMQETPLYEWISMKRPQSLESLRHAWSNIADPVSPDDQFCWPTWAVRRLDDGSYIGRVDAEIEGTMEAVNIGYCFFHPFCGKGYATEAVVAATQHLMDHGVHRLVATVTVGNAASARVLEKARYEFKRILVGNDTIRGVVVDDWEYVKCRELI
jgi:RimJ/RimL family protein N-acetyltransferase